ncbi:hypothetical protein pdam_00019449 [Pocillopora damicornis]|uniref:G-protein coupled receptors family 2 profile 2 domain-containing protein n=1 Tax=Pocillopora damicornis TaxID=46731 RepID=A0A3M6UYD2_POCDA|nr:hypothetical protein pdam_00019449 [Pocillopora damicornis]
MERQFLAFLIMSAVLQTFVLDVTSRGRLGFRNFRGRTITTIRAHLPLPPTKAPSTTPSTTGKIRAGNGARNTQSVSVSYSYSKKTFLSKRTPSVAKVPKSTASNVETKAFTQAEDNNTSAFYNTTQWPPTAVTVGNSCVTSGNSMNTTRPTPSGTASSVAITRSDNIANDCRHEEGHNRDKTQKSDGAGIQKIEEFLTSKGCFSASFDEESGEFIFESPATTKESMRHEKILNTLETTLMSFSITAEVISFAFLSVVRVSKSERIFVHKNLLISLAFGHTVYILDINIFPSRNMHHVFNLIVWTGSPFQTICSVIAAVQHYLYTSLYTWMLIEGINLYLKIVKVFSFGNSYATYSLIGWGVPGVIVGFVTVIQPSTYDMSTMLYKEIMCGTLKLTGTVNRERCWLNGSVWKFKGPVLAMLLANLAVFAVVLRVSFGRIGRRNYAQTTRKGLKAIFALLPLLGVTFLLGFFVDFHVNYYVTQSKDIVVVIVAFRVTS